MKNRKDNINEEITKTLDKLQKDGTDISGFYYGIKNQYQDKITYGRKFTKFHMSNLCKILDKLPVYTRGVFITLTAYIQYNTGMLIKDDKPMNKNDIAKIVGVSRNTVNKHLDKLIDVGVLLKDTGNNNNYCYYIHPWIVCKGRCDSSIVEKFEKKGGVSSSKPQDPIECIEADTCG